jgi:hypothetical protein
MKRLPVVNGKLLAIMLLVGVAVIALVVGATPHSHVVPAENNSGEHSQHQAH